MQVSVMGRELVKKFEGLHTLMKDGRVRSYLCPVNKWTIGYGHTRGVKSGQYCTKAEAEQFLTTDLQDCERAILRLVKVPLTQNQFDALASFIFNLGEENFKTSTLLKRLNAGKYGDVPEQLARWNKATVNGKKVELAGLTRRRAAEAALYTMDAPLPSSDDGDSMPQDVSISCPKPLTQSKTMAGASLAGLGLAASTIAEQLEPLVGVSQYIAPIFTAVSMVGIFLTVYARWSVQQELTH